MLTKQLEILNFQDPAEQSHVEATFARFKKVIGNKINSKDIDAQINEIGIAILALNKMKSFRAPKAQKSC